MIESNPRKTARSVIPDDPEASVYRLIIVAAKRARHLQNGSRGLLPGISWRPWKKCGEVWSPTMI